MVRTARRNPGIERENVARPIGAGAKLSMLVGDARTVLAHPHPRAFDERFAAEVLARQAFLREFAFDDVLRGDAGVVFAGQPERGVA